jgi:hypothetical protein
MKEVTIIGWTLRRIHFSSTARAQTVGCFSQEVKSEPVDQIPDRATEVHYCDGAVF